MCYTSLLATRYPWPGLGFALCHFSGWAQVEMCGTSRRLAHQQLLQFIALPSLKWTTIIWHKAEMQTDSGTASGSRWAFPYLQVSLSELCPLTALVHPGRMRLLGFNGLRSKGWRAGSKKEWLGKKAWDCELSWEFQRWGKKLFHQGYVVGKTCWGKLVSKYEKKWVVPAWVGNTCVFSGTWC